MHALWEYNGVKKIWQESPMLKQTTIQGVGSIKDLFRQIIETKTTQHAASFAMVGCALGSSQQDLS